MPGIKINIDAVHTTADIPKCMSLQDMQRATFHDEYLQLKDYIIRGWPQSRNEILLEMISYWTFRDDLLVLNGIVMKGKCIIIPKELQEQALEEQPQGC